MAEQAAQAGQNNKPTNDTELQPRSIKLLIAHEDPVSADATRDIFQQAGWPTHAHRLTSIEDLENSLQNDDWNIIVAYGSSEQYKPAVIGKYARQYADKIHAIYLDETYSATNALQIVQCGFCDYLTVAESERLLYVAAREIDALANSKKLLAADHILAEVNARSQLLMDSSLDAIAYVTDGMIVNVNQAFAEQLGFADPDDLDCYPIADLVAAKDQATIRPLLRQYQKGEEGESSVTIEVLTSAGEGFRADLSIAAATYDGEPCTQLILRSHIDAAAGDSRASGEKSLEQIFATAEKGSMLYVAVDFAAGQRQELGLQHCSSLIAKIGKTINTLLPSAANVNRYLQENWLVILPDSFKHDPQVIARELCEAIEKAIFDVNDNDVKVTLSIGISRFGVADMTHEIALERSFSAAGEKQMNGGNGYKMFAPKIANASGAAALQTALQHDSFSIRYQPVVGLQDNDPKHYEAVLHIDNGGDVKPATELVASLGIEPENVALDRWQFEALVEHMSGHLQNGDNTRVFMPLTASAMMDEGFILWASETINGAAIPFSSIIFSIDAKMAAHHSSTASTFIKDSKQQGIDICFTNTTREDENTIKQMQPGYVKLCGELITFLGGEEPEPHRLFDVIDRVKEMNVTCIASNVSSAAELAQLWQTGVPFIQGSYLQGAEDHMDYDFFEMG